uniref:Uncharacterized protein n=1 Tax=Pseudonaja textilis TaxID=8673 RepID=A0A670Z6A9_PSETE
MPGNAVVRTFRVTYKRHVVTMDDLQTLFSTNWLNDQGKQGQGVGGGVGTTQLACTACPPDPRPRCERLQVMNMYGDLVMDTVPEKVSCVFQNLSSDYDFCKKKKKKCSCQISKS